MIDVVKVALDVGIDYPVLPRVELVFYGLKCVFAPEPWPEAIATRVEVDIIDRLDRGL